jgi:hypothetical protein
MLRCSEGIEIPNHDRVIHKKFMCVENVAGAHRKFPELTSDLIRRQAFGSISGQVVVCSGTDGRKGCAVLGVASGREEFGGCE